MRSKKDILIDLALAIYVIAETIVILGWGLVRALWMPVAWICAKIWAISRRWPATIFALGLLFAGIVLAWEAFRIGGDNPMVSTLLLWGGVVLFSAVLWRIVMWLVSTGPHPLED